MKFAQRLGVPPPDPLSVKRRQVLVLYSGTIIVHVSFNTRFINRNNLSDFHCIRKNALLIGMITNNS